MGLKISQKGLDLIKKFEGCRLTAYKDSVGVWTIGYGVTSTMRSITGTVITEGMKIDQQTANEWLEKCVNKKFIPMVEKYDKIYHFNQNQIDALTSFAYNLGTLDKLTDKGNRSIEEISEKMLSYNKAGGKVLAGLTTRRKEERKLFDTPVGESAPAPVEDKKGTKYRVTATALNYRKGPGTNYGVVGVVKKNEVYTITEIQNNFGRLLSGAGWLSMNYMTKV